MKKIKVRNKKVILGFNGKSYILGQGDTLTVIVPRIDFVDGDVSGSMEITKGYPIEVLFID